MFSSSIIASGSELSLVSFSSVIPFVSLYILVNFFIDLGYLLTNSHHILYSIFEESKSLSKIVGHISFSDLFKVIRQVPTLSLSIVQPTISLYNSKFKKKLN